MLTLIVWKSESTLTWKTALSSRSGYGHKFCQVQDHFSLNYASCPSFVRKYEIHLDRVRLYIVLISKLLFRQSFAYYLLSRLQFRVLTYPCAQALSITESHGKIPSKIGICVLELEVDSDVCFFCELGKKFKNILLRALLWWSKDTE